MQSSSAIVYSKSEEMKRFRLDINISVSSGDLAADGKCVLCKQNCPLANQPLHFKHILSLRCKWIVFCFSFSAAVCLLILTRCHINVLFMGKYNNHFSSIPALPIFSIGCAWLIPPEFHMVVHPFFVPASPSPRCWTSPRRRHLRLCR